MTTLAKSLGILVVLTAALLGASRLATGELGGPCVLLSGPDSAIRESRCVRVTSPEEWAALWLEHKGLPAKAEYDFHFNQANVPVIDFATHVVVSVFSGEVTNCAGLRTEALESKDGRSTLRYASKSYQTIDHADAVRPYGFFVLPRTGQPLQVEEQIYSMTGPSRIEARASFPALP